MRKRTIAIATALAMAAGTLLGGTTVMADEAKPAELRLVMYGEAGARNTEFFKNELHDRLMEDLNIDLSIDYVPWGSKDQIATMLASGEKMAFMSNLNTQFASWVQSGYVASFDEDMIKSVAPAYMEARMGNGFEASRFNGETVMLPVGAICYSNMYDNFSIRNDILNEVGWDVSNIKTYDDLVEAMKAVKEAKPDFPLVKDVKHLQSALDSVYGNGAIFPATTPLDIVEWNLADDSDKVISWFESEEFGNLCRLEEEWFDMGLITVEHVTDQSIYQTAYDSGNCLLGFGVPSNIYDHEVPGVENADMRYLQLDDSAPYIVKDYDWAWSVSAADEENVENYLRLFNWIYETKENYLFALYGIEGVDYDLDEYGTVVRKTTDGFFYDWMHKTFYYEPISTEKYDPAEVEEYMNFTKDAFTGKKMGFLFDVTPVETEYSLLEAIIQEKVKPIAYGISSYDEKFPEVLEELKEAGLDKYVEEYQKQFSAYMANK